jgi:hypothetical protein
MLLRGVHTISGLKGMGSARSAEIGTLAQRDGGMDVRTHTHTHTHTHSHTYTYIQTHTGPTHRHTNANRKEETERNRAGDSAQEGEPPGGPGEGHGVSVVFKLVLEYMHLWLKKCSALLSCEHCELH